GTGAIVLTFLAGAELDPKIFRTKWKESTIVGLVGFFGPFLGCAAVAHYVLHWTTRSSWLAGVALSTTSVAVVYAVMLLADVFVSLVGALFFIKNDAREFLVTLLEVNSTRVQSDILNRIQESHGHLEVEIRKLLHEVSRMAEQALSNARRV